MAIQQGQVTSFKKELLLLVHNFAASGGDTFKIALYTANATLGPDTTVYTTTAEASGTGYVAGGATLVNVEPAAADGTAYWSFDTVEWASSSITARGALIYNSSKSNKAVAVLDFGADKTTSNATFRVAMPAVGSTSSLLRIE